MAPDTQIIIGNAHNSIGNYYGPFTNTSSPVHDQRSLETGGPCFSVRKLQRSAQKPKAKRFRGLGFRDLGFSNLGFTLKRFEACRPAQHGKASSGLSI